MPKYINCGDKYQATTFRYPKRQNKQALVWKNKAQKTQESNPSIANERSDKREISVESQENKAVPPKLVDIELDISIYWAASPK